MVNDFHLFLTECFDEILQTLLTRILQALLTLHFWEIFYINFTSKVM